MLEHLLFWLAVAAVVGFFKFTDRRRRSEWGRFAAGLLLLISFASLGVEITSSLLR